MKPWAKRILAGLAALLAAGCIWIPCLHLVPILLVAGALLTAWKKLSRGEGPPQPQSKAAAGDAAPAHAP